jgi:hypothetical protein
VSKEHQSIFNLRRAASTFAGSTITFGSDLRQHRSTITLRSQSFEKALWLGVEVETLAKMYVHALAIGGPPHLSEVNMAQVHEQMRRMSYEQAPDLDGVAREVAGHETWRALMVFCGRQGGPTIFSIVP